MAYMTTTVKQNPNNVQLISPFRWGHGPVKTKVNVCHNMEV
jgi:hypothetical protein